MTIIGLLKYYTIIISYILLIFCFDLAVIVTNDVSHISLFISQLIAIPQMRYSNTTIYSARCIIIFIFILADLQSVIGDPLKILSFTYRTKQFEILELTMTNNIITLEVDQDLYHQVQCPIEFSEVSRAQFVPCCNANVTSGCYKPKYSDEKCIDENHSVSTGIMQADETSLKRYSLRIANYQTCHSISMLAKAVSGNI